METTNEITFTDEDMEVKHPNHHRSLYLMATINGVQVRRALVDIEASLSLIALSTLEAVGLKAPSIQAQSGPFRRILSSDHYSTNWDLGQKQEGWPQIGRAHV